MSDGLGGGLIHLAGSRRWSRRNWWGLAALLPLLAAVVVFAPGDAFQTLRDENTEQVVRPGESSWASYGGARLRLVGFGPAELVDSDGEPFDPPGGLAAWRVTLGVDTGGDPEALLGCRLELEDTAGRLYLDKPNALATANVPPENPADFASSVSGASCTPPYDTEDETAPFETVGYFLLPESTEPVALRVSQFEQAPAYVRLDVG